MHDDVRNGCGALTRRGVLAGAAAGALLARVPSAAAQTAGTPSPAGAFWPGGARLAVSITMMFEADGGQPELVQNGPAGTPRASQRFPNYALSSQRDYGWKEGIPRLLDLFARRQVRVSSFMIGQSVDRHPALAKEIVSRGHEAAAHGRLHALQWHLPREEERAFVAEGVERIRRATGVMPIGYNTRGLQRGPNTLSILQELGFRYHIDDRSRDEPFILPVDGKPFAVLPYMGHLNDIDFFASQRRSLDNYERMLREELETLYEEGERRRRMMSVPLHDYLAGRPAVSRAVEAFIAWAQARPGVWFARRDEIAAWALESPLTPREPAET